MPLLCVFLYASHSGEKFEKVHLREACEWHFLAIIIQKYYYLLHNFLPIFRLHSRLICKCMGRTKLHFLRSYGITSTVTFAQRFHIWFGKKMNKNPRKVILKVQFLGKRDQKIFSKLTIHSIIPRKKVYHYCNRSTYREVYAFR